jgi:hypothetical protein
MERDEDEDGKADLKVFYKNGKRYKIIKDRDNDSRFEITQWFNQPKWSMVMELDADGDGLIEGRYCYKEGILRLKEIDEDSDGNLDLREHYNAEGKLVKSEEANGGTGRINITWFHNRDEEAYLAEKDNNQDGRVDTSCRAYPFLFCAGPGYFPGKVNPFCSCTHSGFGISRKSSSVCQR